jgi:hypothetical protein
MKTPPVYYLALAVFCVVTLFIGMASAADTIVPSARTSGAHGHGFPGMNMTNATMQQHIIAGLAEKGVDVSAVTPLLRNDDNAAVSTWLTTYFESHKGERMNITARFNASAGIPFHGERGGNLSAIKTAFHGDMAAGANWSGTRLPPHNGGMAKNATRCNATTIISDLEKKGVDISAVKTALQNGDITTVTTWLKSNFNTDRNEPAPRNATRGHRNSTGLQGRP